MSKTLLQILQKLHEHRGDRIGEKSSCERFCKVPNVYHGGWGVLIDSPTGTVKGAIESYSSRRNIFIFSKDVNKLLIFEVVNWKLDLLVPSLLLFFALTRRVRRDYRLLPILLCHCCEDFSHTYPSGREYVLKQTAFSLLDYALWMRQVWSFCFIYI